MAKFTALPSNAATQLAFSEAQSYHLSGRKSPSQLGTGLEKEGSSDSSGINAREFQVY